MKTISPGLSDSIASVLADPRPCPHCDSSSHIAGGLCVGCLLEAGLDPEDEGDSESLVGILAEINLPDQNWRLGNYEILEEIGRGGMGVIYRARQRHSRRIVAVKRVLSYHSDSRETLARFRREAQAAASLDHPNILPIYEVSESEDGLPFFSMKFAPGGTLQQVAPALRTEPRQCVALVAKIARAVQYAHGHGILHRDLKPGNILLDARGEPLVSDFGLAKWLDTTSDLTRTLTIFGTPGYIAPEQASSAAAELKPTADIYSLGAILFDLLAGRPPFLGAHALSVIRQAAELPAPKLRSLSKIADRDLETICSRCLDREPSARYPSAHDLAEDLERWLEGRPIIARPVLLTTQLWRWSRRNPVVACAACACLILSSVAISVWASRYRLDKEIQSSQAALRSVLVLPFEDLDELTDTPLAAQITREMMAGLPLSRPAFEQDSADIHPSMLRPVHPSEWQQLGRSFGVHNLLAGTVRVRNGKTCATLQLVDTSSGRPMRRWLYNEVSRADLSLVAVQRVNAALEARASRIDLSATPDEIETSEKAQVTENSLARDYFLSAQELQSRYNIADLYRAIELTEKSVGTDPRFARAQALLASLYLSRSELDPTGPWLEKGLTAARLAIQLGPRLPEAHRAFAGTFRYRGQMRRSIDSFLSAYELDPSDHRNAGMLGNTLEQVGRPDLALRWLDKAARTEPRPGLWMEFVADAWTDLGEEGEAAAAYNRAITFRPDLPGGDIGLARLALFRRDFTEARARCQETRRKFNNDHESLMLEAQVELYAGDYPKAETLYRQLVADDRKGGVDFTGSCRFLGALGFIRKAAGDEVTGDSFLREARSYDLQELEVAPDNIRRLYSLAAINAALGEPEAALNALNRAIAAGWIDFQSMSLDPRFRLVRDTNEFRSAMVRVRQKVDEMRMIARTHNSAAQTGEH
ncbi:MAG: eukaryotic-like serine/threonine-protein kinase [Verrucomicrobiota bacterium]|jgi:serine/threonine protein kinase/tetratricopeptide (TPR) repeat protein